MRNFSRRAMVFFAAILFFSNVSFAQKRSKKDKPVAEISGDSAAIAATEPVSKKKAKKAGKSWEPKIVIPDTSAEEMPVPEPIGLVSDFGNIFTQGQEDTLTAMIKAFHDSTKDEVMIVAWDTLHLVPEQMDAYVHKVGVAYEIGTPDRNNGILIAFSAQLRKIRIENCSGGLTDKETWEIVHKVMLPYFASNNYYAGTLAGLSTLIKKLNSE